tara:strand:- start:72 stop:812 length:741 start_codon:yes stop_codon:yes gene_type:complete
MSLGLGLNLSKGVVKNPPLSAYSLSFDGSGDYVAFTETAFPIGDDGDKFSVSFWAQRDTTATSEDAVLTNTSTWKKRINFDTAGTGLLMEGDFNGQQCKGDVTADTAWHHYVITLNNNGAQGFPIVYEDGAAVSTALGSLGANEANFTINSIGSPSGGGVTGFDGLLYQIAIWDVTLSANAVASIYNFGSPVSLERNTGNYESSGDLVTLWKFAEGTGSTTADSVGSLTGTLNGDTAFSSTTPINP